MHAANDTCAAKKSFLFVPLRLSLYNNRLSQEPVENNKDIAA
jgi:hypothetical protein